MMFLRVVMTPFSPRRVPGQMESDMCFPSAPAVTPAVPAPVLPDSAVQTAGANSRAAAAAAVGATQMDKTGPQGLTQPATTTASKTLMGN